MYYINLCLSTRWICNYVDLFQRMIFYILYSILQISREDIRWESEDPGIPHRGGSSGRGHGAKKSFSRSIDTLGVGRGRGHPKPQPRTESHPPQNGIVKRVLDEFELLNTDSLVKEVR